MSITIAIDAGTLISGDEFNGTWTCDVIIPQGSEAGTWTANRVLGQDNVGNTVNHFTSDLQALGFPTQLDVTFGGGSPPP